MGTGWEQLRCTYFHDICLHVFEDYFSSEGFLFHRLDEIGGVVFESEKCYVEISYEAETYPHYSPTIVIGICSNVRNENLSVTGVPFWFLITFTYEASKYTFWRFGMEEELFVVLERIKNDVIKPFGPPLWENVELLKKAIRQFIVDRVK